MPQKNYAIPPGSRVLVTGANGYIASHVCDILLGLGYIVRGTVRAEKPWLDEFFANRYGKDKYESVIVPAMEDEHAFDAIMQDMAGVVHIASDTTLRPDPNEVVPGVIAGIENILRAASKHCTIKRFVLTSSSTAVLIPKPNEKRVVGADTWNDDVVRAAYSNDTPLDKKPYIVYAASKTEGERSAWKWVAENKPGFEFNVVIPNVNFGRILMPEVIGSTMKWVSNLLHGDPYAIKVLPPKWFVDVEDNARLHVCALLDSDIKHERIFAFAQPQNWTDVIGILRKLRPSNTSIPDPPENEGRDLTEVSLSKRAEQLLQDFFGQAGWTSLEDSLANGIDLN